MWTALDGKTIGPPVRVELVKRGPLGIKHDVGLRWTVDGDEGENASRSSEPDSENSISYSRSVSRWVSEMDDERRYSVLSPAS